MTDIPMIGVDDVERILMKMKAELTYPHPREDLSNGLHMSTEVKDEPLTTQDSTHEILFCGKRLDGGGWITGHYVQRSDINNASFIVTFDCHGMIQWFEVDPKTVCQFTGRFDEYGARIYSGDVCRVNNLLYKVEFKHSAWQFTPLSSTTSYSPPFNIYCEHCTVVGNIYDDPWRNYEHQECVG